MAESATISESYRKAVALVATNPGEAVQALAALQERVARASLFSENESLEDWSTGTILVLALEHHLAMALTQAPTSPLRMKDRQQNLARAGALWSQFLRTLERLELLSASQAKDVQILEDLSGAEVKETARMVPPTIHRDAKIARHHAKQQATLEQQRLQALVDRRNRLGVDSNDTMDGYDDDGLQRELALKGLEIYKQEAIEEWSGAIRELPMIARMAQQQDTQSGEERYRARNEESARPDPRNLPPLQLTHITQDAAGQLHMQRETARTDVFRRGWNQPTMSLEELAEHEVADAVARGERQKIAEAQQQEAPRRFEQLAKDGMEDREDLVDASAELDRQWDDWKDQNPRGSGNKRGDVGDRNF
jgi:hypothetical protein